jgi:hypothetical protein
MRNTRSDTDNDTTETHEATVRRYLRANDEVASKEDLRAGTDVPAWYIDQIATTDAFYTSLNHNGKYVASKYLVGHRSTHDGFWRPEVDDGVAVFHRKEDTKPTLKHLAFKRPSGLTPPKANDLLGRRCYWASLTAPTRITAIPKQTTSSVAVVTAHFDNLPNKERYMPLTGRRRLSTLTAGRPDGTTSSLSAKLTNPRMSR